MKSIRFFANADYDFMSKRYFAFAFSGIILAASIFLVITRGLNFGIDFTGGLLLEVRTQQAANIAEMRNQIGELGLGDYSLQTIDSNRDVMIRVQASGDAASEQQAVIESIKNKLGPDVEYRRAEYVGPQVGRELIEKGTMAVLLSSLGILLYVWFRFEWQFGITTIVSVVHDVIVILGFFALTQMDFNLTTIAAILTVAGYSVNDTIVVLDRVREDLRKYRKMDLHQLFNKAINATLSRTVLTSGTTLLSIGALWLFGGEVLRSFVSSLLLGVVIGTYSSIYVATQMLLYMNIRRTSGKDIGESTEAVAG
ncbi:MAG TPA: protein translocase subunit SecF [Rhodospirillaceae bacterium]|nr:MAG: protein-export membrane protein SecF [Alphaproteobacteria bacterium GWF2_58_20]HAU28834.1 protein translocase subunit SecF [Rhodospirillaceae bacterium]